MINTSGCCYSI